MTTLLAVVSISIGISFLCSILEAVLLSVSHAYVALLEDRGDPAGPLLTKLRRQIDEPIAAILTLNTIAHTVGAAVSGALALDVFGSKWMAAFSAVLTLLILVLSEIIPKTLGARYWQQLAPLTARVLRVMIIGMRPVLAPLSVLNRLIGAGGHGQASVSRAELEILAEVGRREGQIDDAEWQVVANVMRLRDVVVNEVMTPRTAIVAIPTSTTVLEAQAVMLDTGFLRLPVYNESVDNIVGILLARDLWRSLRLGERTITSIMREPMLVPETKRVEALIPEMRARRIKMAVVLDEFGGTAGIVTFEDLVEEIVGEIQDEHESGPLPYERISPSEVLANGGASLAELANELDLELPVELYDTIGGYVFGQIGHLPKVGDGVTFLGGSVRVLAMDKRRVARVAIHLLPVQPEEHAPLA
jgi:putative hemolysin